MDIAKLSMSMASVKLAQSVQVSMLKKTMEQMEQTGTQITEMMKNTGTPSNHIIDIKA